MNNYVLGNLSLLKVWGRSQLAINGSAGGYFSSDSTQSADSYEQLVVSQSFQLNRWQIQLLDQFSYLPQTSIGFGGGTGLGVPGAGGSVGPVIPGLGNNYVPNQSIYAAQGPRYSNASIIQTTYLLSPRASVTLSGSYGFLSFVDPGNVDNQMASGTAGYNYSLSRQDTLGIFYQFSSYHFSGQPEAYGNHSVNFAYGRKLPGHLALQAYGGPAFTTSRVSTNGNTVTHGLNFGLNANRGLRRGGVTVGYSHSLTGGSGIINGSTADILTVGFNHDLSRLWSAQVNGSYAHNKPIDGFGTSAAETFNTWNFGGGLNRPLSRTASLGIAYNATVTRYSSASCTTGSCNLGQTYNYVTITIQWHARPLVLP